MQSSRFTQNNFLLVGSIEGLLRNSANGKPFSLSEETVRSYQKDIDKQKLNLHLQLLSDVVKSVPLDGIPI